MENKTGMVSVSINTLQISYISINMGNCIGFKCFEDESPVEGAQFTVVKTRNSTKRVPILKKLTENKLILKRQMYKKNTVASIGELSPSNDSNSPSQQPAPAPTFSRQRIPYIKRRSKSNLDLGFKFVNFQNSGRNKIADPVNLPVSSEASEGSDLTTRAN